MSVYRRYSDFDVFHELLLQRFAYRMVPALPPKRMLKGGMDWGLILGGGLNSNIAKIEWLMWGVHWQFGFPPLLWVPLKGILAVTLH